VNYTVNFANRAILVDIVHQSSVMLCKLKPDAL